MKILNLTQHSAGSEQIAAGVVEPADKVLVQATLTMEELPTKAELEARARALAYIAAYDGFDAVMIGGAPYLMAPLERALKARGIRVLYAFSKRDSIEVWDGENGGTKKTNVFRFAGFVEV